MDKQLKKDLSKLFNKRLDELIDSGAFNNTTHDEQVSIFQHEGLDLLGLSVQDMLSTMVSRLMRGKKKGGKRRFITVKEQRDGKTIIVWYEADKASEQQLFAFMGEMIEPMAKAVVGSYNAISETTTYTVDVPSPKLRLIRTETMRL